MVKIKRDVLASAELDGADKLIDVLVDAYKKVLDNAQADNMLLLNGSQHTLLAYHIFREELMIGGFCQLIQNGYGGYIFNNPFAKVMRLWGLQDFSKLIYKAKKIYDAHKEDLEKERDDDAFMAMYEDYEVFDDLEEDFLENEESISDTIAQYVTDNLSDFVEIID